MGTKQVIVINRGTEPKMRRGKEIAQASHAVEAWFCRRLERDQAVSRNVMPGAGATFTVRLKAAEIQWMAGSYKKVTLYVTSTDELLDLCRQAMDAGLEAHLITDAGMTEFGGVPTPTALAIGPDYDEKIDPVTGHLPLY